jgi:ATP-dependent Clp protease ATP-binding subunit ClpX
MSAPGTDLLTCSFCGTSQDEVKHLIRGAGGACICEECVGLCQVILAPVEEPGRNVPGTASKSPALPLNTSARGSQGG